MITTLRHTNRALVSCLLIAVICGWSATGQAISRDEVLVRAQSYCYHPWTCASKNLTASCSGSYQSAYAPGDYMGLPYDWGGYVTLFEFDDGIDSGKGAGSYPENGVLGCTVGVDCSGFVSKVWDVGHFGTATIHNTSHKITSGQVKVGDAFNVPSYHIVLFGGKLSDGWPVFYEAIGYNAQVNSWAGWANVDGFQPIRLDGIQDQGPGPVKGTPVEPIKVTKFPFVQAGDTTKSVSDLFDYYGADTSKKETGPEFVYELEITSPGKLTVSVQDGPGVDIDVHVCSALDTYHCIARHDSLIELEGLGCGTWYVVADTWCNSSGAEFPGPYTITIDFDEQTGSCSAANEPYEFFGEPGDACGYPGDPNLPFCNPNLGGEVCLYSNQLGNKYSFCTFNCGSDYDCQADLPGGCCEDITGANDPQDFYCLPKSYCEPDLPDPVDEEGVEPGKQDASSQPDVVVAPEIVSPADLPPESDTTSGEDHHTSADSRLDSVGPAADGTEPEMGAGTETPVAAGDLPAMGEVQAGNGDDAVGDGNGSSDGGCQSSGPGSAPTSAGLLLLLCLGLMVLRRVFS